MSAEYVRRCYGVDYKRGDHITVDGRAGVIVSFPEQYLGVRFDDQPKVTIPAHPTWRVERVAVVDALCQFCGAETTEHDPAALLCAGCNSKQVAVVRAHLDHVSGTVWTGGPL